MSEYDDLAKRVAALEVELAEAKKALEVVKPKEPFKPKMTMPRIDYTEGMSMSGSALKPMVDLVNPQGLKFDPSAWARNSYPQPGGFGAPVKPSGAKRIVVERGSGWVKPPGLEPMIKGRWSK